jgi:thiamine pyrophosphate-dependent acetolactate synthase large subunit-like protein
MKKDRSAIDVPAAHSNEKRWGSDLIAETIRAMGFRHVTLNPGSSFRGLHDSIVNHLGNRDPQMLLCLHEEHAVSIAHGWAKVTSEPMAVILHANVGLMHASMAIYNAWCDRVPMVIFGATGPVDADKRRPWIDWIHTSRDQAALVRPYVKFDDQPAGLEASLSAIARARTVAATAPYGPTYVCFDVAVQEAAAAPVALPDPALFQPPEPPAVSETQIETLVSMLSQARAPVFLMGRVSRSGDDWTNRIALTEHLNARVITDIKTGASFPTDHPAHVGPPSFFTAEGPAKALAAADLIVAFDWVDPAGAIRQSAAKAPLVNVSMDHQLANGWSLDHMAQPAARLHIAALPDTVIGALVRRLELKPPAAPEARPVEPVNETGGTGPLTMPAFAAALAEGLSGESVTLVRLPLGWDGASLPFRHPLDYLGYDGGAGIGSGPGMLVGAALALEGSGRIPVAVLGDGDTMMGISAFWSAARYGIPLIAVVCNNRSYFNDEVHQEKVARMRGRPVENKGVGQEIREPDIDFAAIARAQGMAAIGPVGSGAEMVGALRQAVSLYREGASVLIDVRVEPAYAEAMSKGMTEDGG